MGTFTEYFLSLKEKVFFSWEISSYQLIGCPSQVYMYAAWNGWTIPMFLFLALLRLSLNYLIARSLFPPSLFSAIRIGHQLPSCVVSVH